MSTKQMTIDNCVPNSNPYSPTQKFKKLNVLWGDLFLFQTSHKFQPNNDKITPSGKLDILGLMIG